MKTTFCLFLAVLFSKYCDSEGFSARKLQGIAIAKSYDPGHCKYDNEGDTVIVKDRLDNDKVLICLKSKDEYKWRAMDGSKSPGEFFNPAHDCSDIIDNTPDAESGFYWINFGSDKIRKVWCDMKTDGGGFMLIGRKNNSITWSVPSNNEPVDPLGEPHWSSAFGDAPILDFRIQLATSETFDDTVSHWSFRLQKERPLGKLMVLHEGGCNLFPGIGDISYVKDIITEKVVTSTFRCSRFGGFYHPTSGLGWAMMNSCLQKPCTWGFAFHHSFPYQIDYSGAFSYSTRYPVSGISHNATSFIGCDQGHCCGCFGPKGSFGDYCGPKCQSVNGGVITTDVYTWFWVRSKLPKRIWKKCMEYSETNDNGEDVTYVIDEKTGVPKKGRCGVNNELTLNDGIVVVPNNSSAAKLPSVSGLLAYRSDNKKVYVRGNKEWEPLAQEKKVGQLVKNVVNEIDVEINKQISQVNERISELNQTVFQEHLLVVDINTQECNSYTLLTSATRSISYTYQGNLLCDNNIGKGWYRFGGSAGTKMATSCIPKDRCSTDVTTWLSGGHPDVSSGIVSRFVCFHWSGGCCEWTHTIRVRNCGRFFVYEFSPSSSGYCSYRYCGTN